MKKICMIMLSFLIIFFAGLSYSFQVVFAEAYTWKFAIDETQNSLQDHYAQIFKKIIEEKSNGEIKLNIYYLGQLGDSSEQVELLQMGGIDLALTAAGAVATLVPESNLFLMHYLFPSDLTKAKELLHSSKAINEKIATAFEKKNLVALDWMDEGYMQWTANRPIRTPDDFKGLKMRVMAAPIITDTYEAYGANPVYIPFSELYSALQLKMADGQTNPIDTIELMKFYEVQDYLMISNSDMYVAAFCMNKQLWESLPQEFKQLISDVVKEVQPLYTVEQTKYVNEKTDKILKGGTMKIIKLTEEEKTQFADIASTTWNKYLEVGGPNAKDILDTFLEEVKHYK